MLSNHDYKAQRFAKIGNKDRASSIVLARGDSSDLPSQLSSLLRDSGFKVVYADEVDAPDNAAPGDPDLVIVNFSCAESADPERVTALRKQFHKPVVALLAYPSEWQIGQAAAIGADLLIFKPISTAELSTRLRLLSWEYHEGATKPPVRHGGRPSYLELSDQGDEAVCDGRRVSLTPKESALLSLLMSEPGHIFSIDCILKVVWEGSKRAAAADVHQCMSALRKKLEKDPHNPKHITTVAGFGYRLEP
jgi:DNA-binding response OmpR family regulator